VFVVAVVVVVVVAVVVIVVVAIVIFVVDVVVMVVVVKVKLDHLIYRHLQSVVSEMTYTVSNGTLNSSIPYHTTYNPGQRRFTRQLTGNDCSTAAQAVAAQSPC